VCIKDKNGDNSAEVFFFRYVIKLFAELLEPNILVTHFCHCRVPSSNGKGKWEELISRPNQLSAVAVQIEIL